MELSHRNAHSSGNSVTADILNLEFHRDIQSVSNPKIYRGNMPASEPLDMRRLIFYNLPDSITALQIARAAAPFGQVMQVNAIAPLVSGTSNGTVSMLVEFASQNAAGICTIAVNSICQTFISAAGEAYAVGIWVIPTPSFALSISDHTLLEHGYTRTIACSPIAEEYVWFAISSIADPKHILDVDYDCPSKTMKIEFTSVDASFQVIMGLRRGLLSVVFNPDHGERQFVSCKDRVAYAMNLMHLPHDHLQQRFDRPPYNSYWPEKYCHVLSLRNLHPRSGNRIPDDTSTTDDESNETMSTRNTSPDGGNSSRGRSYWSPERKSPRREKAPKQPKELLTDTVQDPGMSGNWDSFFQNRQTISFREWAKYGQIAQHRRKLSIAQGLPPGMIPHCDGSCEFGCKSIKDTPRPEVVDKYLRTTNEDVLISF